MAFTENIVIHCSWLKRILSLEKNNNVKQNTTFLQNLGAKYGTLLRSRGFVIGRASDLQFTGRGFESWLGTIA